MAGCWLFLAAITGLLLAAAAAFAAAVTPQGQAVKAAPGSSVRVDCASGSSASSGGGWNPLGTLSNLLLGYSDEEDDDDDNDDGSSGERAGSDEDYYSWMDLGLGFLDDSSSEEAARREHNLPGEAGSKPLGNGEVVNNSLGTGEVANRTLARHRRATPSWSLGDIDVQGGKNWSVRVFNWVLVRRNPATGQVEVKLQVPGLFSSPAGGSGDYDDDVDVDASDSGREARSTRLEEGVARHPEDVSSGVSSPEYSQSGAS
ncbi:uncharacterized protein LOC126473780 [Schistocerca serialis cubense]|uniref:uncharacterized protein LOC126473780 n=1 Tax=Schistocerca serialis cubense TaxID=2023355 RepID=UPI00214E2AD0|nr:uncharacterized protein LOC126473780 [Schistocerca serialis cubense]